MTNSISYMTRQIFPLAIRDIQGNRRRLCNAIARDRVAGVHQRVLPANPVAKISNSPDGLPPENGWNVTL